MFMTLSTVCLYARQIAERVWFSTNNIFFISSEIKQYFTSGLNYILCPVFLKPIKIVKDSKRGVTKNNVSQPIAIYAAFYTLTKVATVVQINRSERMHSLNIVFSFSDLA